jgi:uncharacterized iron-regulated membrane protein
MVAKRRTWFALLHVCLGAGSALYLLFVCLSGCAVLFEQELYRFFSPDPAVQASKAPRLSEMELRQIASTRYPEQRLVAIWKRKVSAD